MFCQTIPVKIDITDSVTIIYESSKKQKATPHNPLFYYVDGKLSSASAVEAIDPANMKDVRVKRNATGVGEVHIILIDPGKISSLLFLSQEVEITWVSLTHLLSICWTNNFLKMTCLPIRLGKITS